MAVAMNLQQQQWAQRFRHGQQQRLFAQVLSRLIWEHGMWIWKALALRLGYLLLEIALLMTRVAVLVACCWASVEVGARVQGWPSVMSVILSQGAVVVVVVLT